MSRTPPGKGLFGWLGRQLGHVRKAVATDPGGARTVYRANSVEERDLPNQPGMKLRRTVIDEVILEKQPALEKKPKNAAVKQQAQPEGRDGAKR